jgi:hypothetical protein
MGTLDYQSGRDKLKQQAGIVRQMFGPSRKEVWHALAENLQARYVRGGFWKGDQVQMDVGPWTITLDTFTESHGETSTTYTRLRAPYVNPECFRFRIYRTSIFTGIGKWLGMQDIAIGDALFDDRFVIQGNSEERIHQLLRNTTIRDLLLAQPRVMFQVKDDEGWFGSSFPEGVDELEFRAIGVIKDLDQLKKLFDLFAETLEELCRIGSAYAEHPRVEL